MGLANFQKLAVLWTPLAPRADSTATRERATEQGAVLQGFYQQSICRAVVEMADLCMASILTSFRCAFRAVKARKVKMEFLRLLAVRFPDVLEL